MAERDEGKWQKFVETAFKAAGLPEITEDQLEPGTYTNQQVADRFRDDPIRLVSILMDLPKSGSPASDRSVLSFAVDMMDNEEG